MEWGIIGRGAAAALLTALLTFLTSAGWASLAANAGTAVLATSLFFDVAVLGAVVLSILGLIVMAAVGAALLLGVWGDTLKNLKRMGWAAARAALAVLPVAVAWTAALVHLEVISKWWALFLVLLWLSAAAVAVIAGTIFTLIIVRVLVMPACLPPRLFTMLTGMPEDGLDTCREDMTAQGWEPLAVQCEDGVIVDSMIWTGAGGKPSKRWAVWFLPNCGRYEEYHNEMEHYALALGVSICAFNYRGVGRSTGLAWTFDELVRDGSSVVNALCSRMQVRAAPAQPSPSPPLSRAAAAQIDAAEVIFHGHSLGGAVASLVRLDSPGPPTLACQGARAPSSSSRHKDARW